MDLRLFIVMLITVLMAIMVLVFVFCRSLGMKILGIVIAIAIIVAISTLMWYLLNPVAIARSQLALGVKEYRISYPIEILSTRVCRGNETSVLVMVLSLSYDDESRTVHTILHVRELGTLRKSATILEGYVLYRLPRLALFPHVETPYSQGIDIYLIYVVHRDESVKGIAIPLGIVKYIITFQPR